MLDRVLDALAGVGADETLRRHERSVRAAVRGVGRGQAGRADRERRHDERRRQARRDRGHRLRARRRRRSTTTSSSSPATTSSRTISPSSAATRGSGTSPCSRSTTSATSPRCRSTTRSRRTPRARITFFEEKPARADEHADRDRALLLPAADAAADPSVRGGGKQSRPAGTSRRMALPARRLLHVARARQVVRHRLGGDAARGRRGLFTKLTRRRCAFVTGERVASSHVLLDVLLPERCAACERPGAALCADCRASLIRLAPPLCARCGSPGAWPVRRCSECSGRRLAFASARAAILYDEPARRLVLAWKERGRRRLARDAAELVAETLARPDGGVLASVPSDARADARAGPPAGGRARARARHALGAAGGAAAAAGADVSSGGSAAWGWRSAAETSRARSRPRAPRPPASASSTTSTRAERRRPPPRRRSARRGARHVEVVTLARAVR